MFATKEYSSRQVALSVKLVLYPKELSCSLSAEYDGNEDYEELRGGILPTCKEPRAVPESQSHDKELQ